MTTVDLHESQDVVLDGSGNGQATITVPSGQTWDVHVCTVSVATQINESVCKIYHDAVTPGYLIDATSTGSTGDSTGRVRIKRSRQKVIAAWSGGDAGATATLVLWGEIIGGV